MDIKDFEIIRTHNGRDFIIKRHGFPHRYHSHFKRRRGAELVLEWLKADVLATKPYFMKAQRRLTTEEEFDGLEPVSKKDTYYNSKQRWKKNAGVL